MDFQRALQLVQEATRSLHRGGLIPKDVLLTSETVLLGDGSFLDSMAFVALITEIEDRLSQESGTECFLLIGEIKDFDIGATPLTVEVLVRHLVQISSE